MKKLLLTFLLLIQMLCMSTALASPAIPPKPAGADMYVQDYAEVIAPIDKGRILDIGLELQDKTSAQVVVLTVKNLEQAPIEAYAEDVMQNWELGSRESHAGVLMVVATDNKQAYIEVGSGLEGVLPQRLVNTIQKENVQPFFDQGNYSKGILQGYAAVAGTIAQEAGVQLKDATYNNEESSLFSLSSTEKMLIGIGVTVLLLIDNFLLGGLFAEMILGIFMWGRKPEKDKDKTQDNNQKHIEQH